MTSWLPANHSRSMPSQVMFDVVMALCLLLAAKPVAAAERSIQLQEAPGQSLIYDSGIGWVSAGTEIRIGASVRSDRRDRATLSIVLVNNSTEAITITERNVTVSINSQPLKVFAYDELIAKEKRGQIWRNIGAGIAMAAGSYAAANQGRYTNRGKVDGTYSAYGSDNLVHGQFHGTVTIDGTDPQVRSDAIERSNAANLALAQRMQEQQQSRFAALDQRLFKAETLEPGETHGGDIVFLLPPKARQAQLLTLSIALNSGVTRFWIVVDGTPTQEQLAEIAYGRNSGLSETVRGNLPALTTGGTQGKEEVDSSNDQLKAVPNSHSKTEAATVANSATIAVEQASTPLQLRIDPMERLPKFGGVITPIVKPVHLSYSQFRIAGSAILSIDVSMPGQEYSDAWAIDFGSGTRELGGGRIEWLAAVANPIGAGIPKSTEAGFARWASDSSGRTITDLSFAEVNDSVLKAGLQWMSVPIGEEFDRSTVIQLPTVPVASNAVFASSAVSQMMPPGEAQSLLGSATLSQVIRSVVRGWSHYEGRKVLVVEREFEFPIEPGKAFAPDESKSIDAGGPYEFDITVRSSGFSLLDSATLAPLKHDYAVLFVLHADGDYGAARLRLEFDADVVEGPVSPEALLAVARDVGTKGVAHATRVDGGAMPLAGLMSSEAEDVRVEAPTSRVGYSEFVKPTIDGVLVDVKRREGGGSNAMLYFDVSWVIAGSAGSGPIDGQLVIIGRGGGQRVVMPWPISAEDARKGKFTERGVGFELSAFGDAGEWLRNADPGMLVAHYVTSR